MTGVPDDPETSVEPPPRSHDELVSEMRLRPEPLRVVRLSRKMLIALGGVGALALSAALFYALRTSDPAPPPDLINTDSRQTSEALAQLPQDYSAVPRLGAPLPGDLGGPMVAAGIAPDAQPGMPTAAPPTPADSETQAREQHRQQLLQERETARSSGLFTTDADGSTPSPLSGAEAPSSATTGVSLAGSVDAEAKLSMATAERPSPEPAGLLSPTSPNILQAGSVIPAALITGIRSDLPGQVTAQVTQNVYDSPTGRTLLIPQGARLIGQYDAETRFGQRRALLVWTRLILPDARSLQLNSEPAADSAGFAGLEDRVDNHWGQIFKASLISTLLSIGAQAGAGSDEDSLIDAIRSGSSDAVSRVGAQIVGRSLDVRPTLTVRPGFPLRVIVTRDLSLEPWRE